MKITTNNVPRELVSFADLPEKARSDFDYIDEPGHYNPRLFKYRGDYYDAGEYVRIVPFADRVGFEHGTENVDLLRWHGIQTDSYFSATLIRWNYDDDTVIVARASW